MKYSKAQISYHWASVALIVLMATTGMAYRYEILGKGVMTVHQIAGQLLIILLAVRLGTRLIRRTPVKARATWDHRLSQVVHASLYLILIAYVVTGYVSASALTNNALLAPADLAFARSDMGETLLETHYLLKWVLLATVSLHIAGAFKHLVWKQPEVLSHMTFTKAKD